MAEELLRLRAGGMAAQRRPVEERMQALIDKYSSNFEQQRRSDGDRGNSVVVTGATGALGAHLVAQLSARKDVEMVVCLVRARNDDHGLQRVKDSLCERRVSVNMSKVQVYASDLSEPGLGLAADVFQKEQPTA